jgi:hypothetical protein
MVVFRPIKLIRISPRLLHLQDSIIYNVSNLKKKKNIRTLKKKIKGVKRTYHNTLTHIYHITP